MAAKNHGFAASRQRQDQILDLTAANWIETRSRFVQDDEIRVVDKRLRQADSPLHAAMPTTAASTNAAAVRERKSCLPSFPDACRVIRHTGADRATPKPVSRA